MSVATKRVNTYDIFVGNLPQDVDQKRLGKVYSKFGEIHNIWINNSADGTKFSLIKYYCEEDSMKAIEETNGMLFEGGKPISVRKASKRTNERPGITPKKEGEPEHNQEKEETKLGGFSGATFEMTQTVLPKRDNEMKLLISHVETPIIAWGQKISVDNANELASIQEQMAVLCPDLPKVSGKPESDKIYGAQYSEDGCWYRCILRYAFSSERVKVQYIDFGNTEELSPSGLVELPKSLSGLPSCAIKIILHSLWCNNAQDPIGTKYLRDMVESKEVDVFTTARLSDQKGFYGEIYLDGTSVNEKMLESNFVFRKPGLDQKGLLKNRPQGPGGDGLMGEPPVVKGNKKVQGFSQANVNLGNPSQTRREEMSHKDSSAKMSTPVNKQKQEQNSTESKSSFISARKHPISNGKGEAHKLQECEVAAKTGFVRKNQSSFEMPSKPISGKALTPRNEMVIKTVPEAAARSGRDMAPNTGFGRAVQSSNTSHASALSTGMKGGLPGQSGGPRKFDSDKDEINTLRWKLKNLQTEYSSLSNKAQENDLSLQIKRVQHLASMVRKLRNQFPVDTETPLDRAITLAQCQGKIGIGMAESLPEVVKAINLYKTAQDEILKCSDNAILKDKVESRNCLRKELFEKLNTTIEELAKVPLQDRGKQVQDTVAALTKYYDGFMKNPIPSLPAIENLLPGFEEWKAKKKGDVIGARRLSDTYEKTFSIMLSKLQSLTSLSPDIEEEELTEDFDAALKSYTKALQQEIEVADTENSPDSGLVSTLVQALLRELGEEANCVQHLSSVLQEFSSLREQISPWLDSSPTTKELQAVRSKLKSLKSGLRHKLADKVDAEENQDTDELEEIAKEVQIIRQKIHKALKSEDKLLAELSQLASAHFPELINSDNDPIFSAHMTYKGLVKLSRAPDHYTMTSVGSSSMGIFLSEFDEEEVFIKEHFLSNGSHLDKDEFLSQMALYSNASSPHLEPVSAVFFAKNNRHAYVQMKKDGDLLSTLVENASLSKEQIQSIVKSLCLALKGLNLYNFVHGQLQPELIVVDKDFNAKLLPPDFSLSDSDRCRSRYTTNSGVDIIAPEMKQKKVPAGPSHSVDVYCLGLLTLWMHHPTTRFVERSDGTTDFSSLPLDRNLGIFLMKVMHPNPILRPTAEHCLRSEYLCLPPVINQASGGPSPVPFGIDSKALADASTGRNSASPSSVMSQGSNEGLLFAENGGGVQMLANTRVPPPLLGDSQPQIGVGGMAVGQQHQQFQQYQQLYQQQQYNLQLQQQQQQQQQLYHQQQSQFMQQEQQPQPSPQPQQDQNSVMEVKSGLQNAPGERDSFEIGTFDPNAYEVVTSPKPETSARLEGDIGGPEATTADFDVNGEMELIRPREITDWGAEVEQEGN